MKDDDASEKLAFLTAGPMAGQWLKMPAEDLARGIDQGWAVDPEGKTAFELPTPIAAGPGAADFDRWQAGQPVEDENGSDDQAGKDKTDDQVHGDKTKGGEPDPSPTKARPTRAPGR